MAKQSIIPFGPQHPVLPEPIHLDLVLEDENPVLYLEKASRMGSHDLYIIDDEGYEYYDIYDGYPPLIKERYLNHLKDIKETRTKFKKKQPKGGIEYALHK